MLDLLKNAPQLDNYTVHDLLISLDAQYYFINDFLNLVDESIN
jgi:hypothetical protein